MYRKQQKLKATFFGKTLINTGQQNFKQLSVRDITLIIQSVLQMIDQQMDQGEIP